VALTADQRALLQLLLERGQSYGDLAGLLGTDEGDVRGRARAALSELGGVDPDRNVGLSDWLLGQADPIGRADVVRHLKQDSEDHALAQRLLESLSEIAPQAELPRLPGEPRSGGFLRRPAPAAAEPAAAPGPVDEADGRRGVAALSRRQTRLIAILATAAVILLIVVLAIAGVFSGGGDTGSTTSAASATSSSTTSPTTTATDCSGSVQSIARVPLKPIGGGDAAGLATVGIANQNVPCLDLQLRNLEPPPNGQTYIVWFLFSADKGYPLAPLLPVSQSGSYDDQIAIPPAVVSLVARAQFIEVALAPDQVVRSTITKASKNNTLVITVPGQAIARGTVPKAASAPGG
jgi:hypothetical protein